MNSSSKQSNKSIPQQKSNLKHYQISSKESKSRRVQIDKQTEQNMIRKKLLTTYQVDSQSNNNCLIAQGRNANINMIESEIKAKTNKKVSPLFDRKRQLTCITQRSSPIVTNRTKIIHQNNSAYNKQINKEENSQNIYSLNIYGGKIKRPTTTEKPGQQPKYQLNQQYTQNQNDKSQLYQESFKRYLTQFQPETIPTLSQAECFKQILSKIKIQADGFTNKRPLNSQLKRLQARKRKSMMHSNSCSLKKITLKQLIALREENEKVIHIIEDTQHQSKKINHQMEQRIITSQSQQYIPNKKFSRTFKKSSKKIQSNKRQLNQRLTKFITSSSKLTSDKRKVINTEPFKRYKAIEYVTNQGNY